MKRLTITIMIFAGALMISGQAICADKASGAESMGYVSTLVGKQAAICDIKEDVGSLVTDLVRIATAPAQSLTGRVQLTGKDLAMIIPQSSRVALSLPSCMSGTLSPKSNLTRSKDE